MLYVLFESGRLETLAGTPTEAVVILFDESDRPRANKVAAELRDSGINTEVSHSARKLVKQIQHAEKRGARFIVIPEADGSIAMKDLSSGEQEPFSQDKMLLLLGKS